MAKREYRVLVVDDDVLIRNLLCDFFTSQGHSCDLARDGSEGLQKAGKGLFDAVITDIVMPNLDGITLAKTLLQKNPNLAIMVMTGFTQEHSPEDVLGIGCRDFIGKPFALDELLIRFNKMMKDHEAALEIRRRQEEIERLSNEMIAGVQEEARQQIDRSKKEVEKLKRGG